MPRTKLYFPKRIPEPKRMGALELKVFERESKKNYRQWIVPVVDHALEVAGLKDGKILDVGCGPGLLIKEIALRSRKFQVTGIDSSLYAIKQAKQNCQKLDNVNFKKANASRLPFDDGVFDLVICKDSLHHFNSMGQVLQEMYRVTKPDRIIYLQDLRRDLPWYLLKMVIPPKNPFQELQFYSARAAYTKKEVKNILNKLDLKPYDIKTRLVTDQVKQKYRKSGIDFGKLKISFQTRYIAMIKKINTLA